MMCDLLSRRPAWRCRPAACLAPLLVALVLAAASPVRAEPGTVRVAVEVASQAIAMREIRPEPVRQAMAEAVAADLSERFEPYWRFTAAPDASVPAALRLHVMDNSARGVDLWLEPSGMAIPTVAAPWRHVWYTRGGLATEALPTRSNAPTLLVEALRGLLLQHQTALREALKSVPVGEGAVWTHPGSLFLVLGLPWDRFQGNRAVFKVQSLWPRPEGPELPVDVIGTALGQSETFAGEGDVAFEALLAQPERRILGSECRRVHEVFDEVRTFRMREIFLEEETRTSLLGVGSGC